MRIPVFVSCPSDLNRDQREARKVIDENLCNLYLEPRALGRSDYPKDLPLKEVLIIARHCHGGIILGFEQFRTTSGKWKRGTRKAKFVDPSKPVLFPTPWNQLEAGILFGLRLPLLIFKEKDLQGGGIFDLGTTEVFIHEMPSADTDPAKQDQLKQVFLKWYAEVSRHYHDI